MIGGAAALHEAPANVTGRLKRVVAVLISALHLAVPPVAHASDPDDETRGVLGGSPPIYDGPPVVDATQTFRLNRFVASGRPAEQYLQLGNRCATKIGIFGPGPKMPVGELCAGIDGNGRAVRGQVVGSGSGKFCATEEGIYGPGQEQPIGMPCRVETKTGFIQGRIAASGQ
jgi:hypothetical protein